MTKPATYAELIRRAMRAKRMTRRDLEHETEKKGRGYSYEHIRKIVSGLPLMSEQFNEDVCRILDLNADDMWQIALREKARNSSRGRVLLSLPDSRFKALWPELSTEDQDRLLKIAEGMAEQRRLQHENVENLDPEELRRRIIEYTNRLPDALAEAKQTPAQRREARR